MYLKRSTAWSRCEIICNRAGRVDLPGAVETGIVLDGALAVGSAGYLERIRPLILDRQQTEVVQEGPELWFLQEAAAPYGEKTESESPFKPGL